MNKIMASAFIIAFMVSTTAVAASSAGKGSTPIGTGHFQADGHFENWHVGDSYPGNWRRHRGYGPDIFIYGEDHGFAGAGCGWLRHEARTTGSRYWWQRYQQCLSS
jgi:hypothetical protein